MMLRVSGSPEGALEAAHIDSDGIDRGQIRAMLALTPEERLLVLQDYVESILEIREANET